MKKYEDLISDEQEVMAITNPYPFEQVWVPTNRREKRKAERKRKKKK